MKPRRALPLLWALAAVAAVSVAAAPVSAAVEAPPDCPEFKSLCIQAKRSGGVDLKSGTAVLEGDVVGFIKAQQLRFTSEALKAFRNEKNEWRRMVLDRKVRFTQPGSKGSAAHAVFEPERIFLFGNGRLEQPPYLIQGEEILIVEQTGEITVRGANGKRAEIHYTGQGEAPEDTLIRAEEAVIEKRRRRMRLIGEASVHRRQTDWRLQAETVTLRFTEEQRMEGFRAEGNVRITQPGRFLRADVAVSKQNNEVILLIGDARVEQPGNFQMTSERLEVFTDAEKGVVQSGPRKEPIRLVFDAAGGVTFQLASPRIEALRAQGVPPLLLFKLDPIVGKSYPNRQAFEAALKRLLTEEEREAHLETIIAHAR